MTESLGEFSRIYQTSRDSLGYAVAKLPKPQQLTTIKVYFLFTLFVHQGSWLLCNPVSGRLMSVCVFVIANVGRTVHKPLEI